MYLGIIQVVKFIYKYLCFQNGSWIRCFGRLTWPRISELIISNFLSKVCLILPFHSVFLINVQLHDILLRKQFSLMGQNFFNCRIG